MRGNTVTVAQVVSLFVEECVRCGVPFGFTSHFKTERLRNHADFWCPNGHPQHYSAESDAEKGERLLAEEKARHAKTLARANELVEERDTAMDGRARAERRLKRVGRGVCPCCNRTFPNLARHMASKHPKEPKA